MNLKLIILPRIRKYNQPSIRIQNFKPPQFPHLICYKHSMKMNKSMWGITHNSLFRQILQLLISVRYTCTSAWVCKYREREGKLSWVRNYPASPLFRAVFFTGESWTQQYSEEGLRRRWRNRFMNEREGWGFFAECCTSLCSNLWR